MTTYQSIGNGQIDQDSPMTQDLFTLLRDNPIAGFEGSTDAPIPTTGWHGNDSNFVGDGNSGLIYNDGGAVANVTSPSFVDGFEYRLLGRQLNVDAGGSGASLEVEVLIGGSYETILSVGGGGTTVIDLDFDLWVKSPRRSARRFAMDYSVAFLQTSGGWNSTGTFSGVSVIAQNGTDTFISGIRVSMGAGNFTDGQVFLLRRKEF